MSERYRISSAPRNAEIEIISRRISFRRAEIGEISRKPNES